MRIRATQMVGLRRELTSDAQDRIFHYLEACYPADVAAADPDWIDYLILDAMYRCEWLNMREESCVCWYAAMLLKVSPYFDREPAIRSVLENRGIYGPDRITLLLEVTDEPDWQRARAHRSLT